MFQSSYITDIFIRQISEFILLSIWISEAMGIIKNQMLELEITTQWLRALSALAEGLTLIPSTYLVSHSCL